MRILILTALLLAPFSKFAFAQEGVSDAKWKEATQAFDDDFKKKSIAFKSRAIEVLPTNDRRTIKFIIEDKKLLSHKDWWVREKSAEWLSKIKIPALRQELHKYAKHRDKKVREGVLAALAMGRDRLDPPVIVEALADPAWEVRRMACWAAGQQRIREAVTPMIGMIHEISRTGEVKQEGETNPRVRSVLLYNLQEITGEYFHTDVEQWRLYWERNKDRTLPAVKRFDVGTFGDVKLEVDDTFARKGSGPVVIALPMTNTNSQYYMPYFNQWLFVRWIFINLPPVRSFPDVQYDEDNDPIYPVDILVDAFEDMRKKRNLDQMAVLAQGFSCWVAAKYAQKYPDRVSGLIMLNPFASNETFGRRIDEAMRTGDPDDEFWAKVSRKQIKPTTAIESARYSYFNCSAYLKDTSDLEIAMLRRIWVDPGGSTIVIPPFDIRGEDTSKTPALIFFAQKQNKLQGIDDMNKFKRYYPKNIVVKLKKSARLPFMEEPENFEKALRLFVDKFLPSQ